MASNVKTCIRLKPSSKSVWCVDENVLNYKDNGKAGSYKCFETLFNAQKNEEIFNYSIRDVIEKFKSGENATIFAYGQTGSGKTHTIFGSNDEDGIVQLSVKNIFENVNSDPYDISFIEIFNERMFDLSNKMELRLFSSSTGIVLQNICIRKIKDYQEFLEFINNCFDNRKNGVTEYNQCSSRSHGILQIQRKDVCISFIDLAGSERASKSKERLAEGSYINKSLLALGKLVNNLLDNNTIGFRDSKLTRILQPSLNSKTNIIALCTLSGQRECLGESLSTINFAARLSNLVLKNESKDNPVNIIKKPNYLEDGELVEILTKRIDSLERTIKEILKTHPNNSSLSNIFVLEKQMFNMLISSKLPEKNEFNYSCKEK